MVSASAALAAPVWASSQRLRVGIQERQIVLIVSFAAYLALAAYLVLALNIMPGDSLSRVGIAYRILYSRDPHLASIGFVWSPLPSLAPLPLLPLGALFPALIKLGFAASVVSAVAMAGCVYLVNGILGDFGVSRGPRLLLTALFAVHPMILYYAANGMSEAMFMFFLLLALRPLCRWLQDGTLGALAGTGVALGIAYATRYEAAAAAGAIIVLVAVVSWLRARKCRDRLVVALCDVVIAGGPFVLVFVAWAVSSWLIVGHPFEHLSSPYGNGAQLLAARQQGQASSLELLGGTNYAIGLILRRVITLEPFILTAAVLGGIQAIRVRDQRVLALFAVFGSVIAFMVVTYLLGMVFGWIRFFIVVIPFTVLLLGLAIASSISSEPADPPRSRPRRPLALPAKMAGATLAWTAFSGAMLAVAIPVSALGMADATTSHLEARELLPLVAYVQDGGKSPQPLQRFLTERAVARYLDRLRLQDGSVLVDTFVGFPIVLYADNPRQFLIPSDNDFDASLRSPGAMGVQYVLVPAQTGNGVLDAVNRNYPAAFSSGIGIGAFIHQFPAVGDSPTWRLYRVRTTTG